LYNEHDATIPAIRHGNSLCAAIRAASLVGPLAFFR
jgi:hypothetical protein